MTLWSRLRSLARAVVGRSRMESEMDVELKFHIETYAEDLVRSGVPREEAMRRARLEFGGIERTKEECRETRGVNLLNSLAQDVRYGARTLRKSPGFAAVAVLTLALGIGANTAIFSVVNAVVLRPLPYPHSDRIVHISWKQKSGEMPDLSVPQFKFCRDHAASFAAVAGIDGYEDHELSLGTAKRWVRALPVTDGFFETLGVDLQVGRPFGREFTRPEAAYAAVLTDSLWYNAFGADPNIVGRQIVLDNQSYTVTGVLPPDFKLTELVVDLFVSRHLGNSIGEQGFNTEAIGRIRPRVSLSQAEAEVRLVGTQFLAQASGTERQEGEGSFHLTRYQDYLASGFRTSLLVLLSAVGLLLLIACSNVASLLLARATARQKEISIRLALGAGRRRLLQQFLLEGLLVGITGGAGGLAAAAAVLRLFVSAIPWDLPPVDPITLDGRVLAFALLVAVGASIAFALTSFFRTQEFGLTEVLKEGRASAAAGRAGGRFLDALVIGEVAISLVLALGAGLLIESLYKLNQEKLGFNPAHLIVMHTPFAPNTFPSMTAIWNSERQALARIQAVPGVQSAAVVSVAPLNGRANLPAERQGHPEDSIGGTEIRRISSEYFSTMGIPILRGHGFRESDFASTGSVVIVNETLARRWWPGENPVGDHIVIGEFRNQKIMQVPPQEVIGVVADVKGMALGRPAPPMVYVPASQDLMDQDTDWVVRTSATAGVADALRKAVTDLVPDQRISLQPMSQILSGSVAEPSFEASLMGTFGGLALLLMLVGVYGVLNFQVARRTHEIGVRIALGAARRDVMRLVLLRAAKLAAVGVAIGLGVALGLAHLIAALLYHVTPTDPMAFGTSSALVLIVAVVAAYLPARHAVRVDPMVALRHE